MSYGMMGMGGMVRRHHPQYTAPVRLARGAAPSQLCSDEPNRLILTRRHCYLLAPPLLTECAHVRRG